MKVHCHTQADKSTVPYARFMWETMLKLSSTPEDLKLTVHCMSNSAFDRVNKWPDVGKEVNAILVPDNGDPLNGSRGHGACVMSTLALTGDGSVHVIADSDTVVVARGWDDYIRIRLVNDRVGIVGSTYEDLGGVNSGAQTVQTYKKVPTLTWCALSPYHDWRTLEVMPNKGHIVNITNEKLSSIYNLPVGYSIFGEVGWQIPQYLHDNSLTYEGWRQLKPTKDAVVLKGLSDYHEEFHVGDVPFMTHHRGSLRHTYRGDRISQGFYGRIDSWLLDEMKLAPRWTWNDPGIELPIHNVRPAGVIVPKQHVADSGWIKCTFNGNVVRQREKYRPGRERLAFDCPTPGSIGTLRIEGSISGKVEVDVPTVAKDPYVIVVRNATNAITNVGSSCKATVDVSEGTTVLLMIDVDGAHRVM